jgi:hypothetical protein
MKELRNALTVLLATEKPTPLKMFFCPYTTSLTSNYKGQVSAILPGYDPEESPFVMVHPQRMKYGHDISYVFRETHEMGKTVDFWIQDQYFMEEVIRTYHCFNCQAPNLYFTGNKTVMFSDKSDVQKGQSFTCRNPICKTNMPVTFTYHGIVKITEADSLS